MTGRAVDRQVCICCWPLPPATRLFVMHQRCRMHALLVERGQQIGEEVFHAAGKGRVVLANMQDAHGFIQGNRQAVVPTHARG